MTNSGNISEPTRIYMKKIEPEHIYDLLVAGGGAGGFFGAIACAEASSGANIALLEKQSKFLSKVAISGGGRCNFTHHCFDPALLVKHYPRGQKELRSVFSKFQPADTVKWFQERGMPSKIEPDGRMFPVSDRSESVIQVLMEEVEQHQIRLFDSVKIQSIFKDEDIYIIQTNRQTFYAKYILLALGGMTAANIPLEGVEWVPPVPSLFSFHIKDAALNALAGTSVQKISVQVAGSKSRYEGPMLVTHHGVSGPAILKASAWEALHLNRMDYHFDIYINWLGLSVEETESLLQKLSVAHASGKLYNFRPEGLTERLFIYLLTKAAVYPEKRWGDLSSRDRNKLQEILSRDVYQVHGKSPNKEEFVTAGGIALKEIDFRTMELKRFPGVYAAGEVLNIDGITGGFNFQAAWSTSYIAGKSIAEAMMKNKVL